MRDFSSSPREMLACLWRNRSLIKASVQREVLGRYRGSIMGLLWSFLNPLFMLAIYTFVFSVVFKARWGTGSDSKTEFALVLFAGLIILNLFNECITRAPSLIISNANYVKKVVFPLEILPFVVLLSAMFHGFISLCVWLFAYMIFFGLPPLTVLYLPVVLLPLLLFIMGLSWALSSLGVYLRDIAQIIGVITTVLTFLSPVFYPVSAIPVKYQHLLYINPLTPVIEQTRNILFWGKPPDASVLGVSFIATISIAWLGFTWFQKTRTGFADVL